jgi:hypothetical protein
LLIGRPEGLAVLEGKPVDGAVIGHHITPGHVRRKERAIDFTQGGRIKEELARSDFMDMDPRGFIVLLC